MLQIFKCNFKTWSLFCKQKALLILFSVQKTFFMQWNAVFEKTQEDILFKTNLKLKFLELCLRYLNICAFKINLLTQKSKNIKAHKGVKLFFFAVLFFDDLFTTAWFDLNGKNLKTCQKILI